MYWIIDRLEGSTAVVEGPDGQSQQFPLDRLPPGVREGDCLRQEGDGFALDREETARRRKRNHDLFRSLLAEEE